jgi:hypothetical protein
MKLRSSYRKTSDIIPEVVRLRAEGRTLQEIGTQFGLSRQRINQIEKAANRHEQIQRVWGFPFSVRTFNVLERLAITSREQALELYHSGHIHPNVVTGFGWVSYKEICDWLEVPMLKKRPKACPHCGEKL